MKMTLPKLNAKTLPVADATSSPGTTTQPQQGPVIIGSPVVDTPDDNDLLQQVNDGEVVEGMTGDVLSQTAGEGAPVNVPPQSTPQPQPQPLSPRLAADDIAKLDELSRTMLEIRGIAVTASSMAQGATMHAQQLSVQTQQLQQSVNVSTQTTEAIRAALVKSVDNIETTFADDYHDLAARLDAIDALLAKHGLPTSAVVATTSKRPTLRLHATRRIVKAATCDNGVVTLYYNPRQGDTNANTFDTQEFTLSPGNVRKVWTGYRVEVPDGYVCDVTIGGDIIASKTGRDDSEFILAMTTRTTNRVINGGAEIAKLSLRKIEPVALETMPWMPQ